MGLSLMIAAGTYGYWHFGQGTVRIASDPPGADVMLDGHILGTTPVLLAPLPPFSDWQVEIRMDGYEMETMRGRVAWRERSVAPPRQLRALPQNILITSEPLGAEVFDGDKSLGITPWESAPIPVGTVISYHLRLRGYDDQHATARVKTGETLRLTVRMEPEKWFAAKATAEERLRLAESGDAYAQALLGYEKFFGPKEGLSADEIASCTKEGESWIRKSAAQKHPLGSALLGSVHVRNGWLNASGSESIILEFKSAVENGLIANPNLDDPIWTFWIGLAYQYGRGVAENKVEAVNCFRKAAGAGLADAMYSLGRCYHLGEGVDKDAAEAAKWYLKAAETGDADGMYSLGRCYHLGEGVTKDAAEAANWFRKAAEAGSADGMRFVGCCYRLGEGVTKDAAEAAKWYLKAAEAGSAIGMDILGWCYTKGEGVTKDSAEAAKWFRKAADAGLVGGMLRLAACYSSGEGVTKDAAEAAKWYLKAAEAGDADGMVNLGRCYHEGEGLTKDAAEAAKWYIKAAEAGDADGMVNLGRCYHLGEGVAKDAAEAVKWYRKAEEQGLAGAQYALGVCYANGEGVKRDYNKALEFANKAKAGGHDCDDLIKHLTAQIKSQANAKTNTTPESLSSAISKPKDKHSMPVYSFSERHRVVRTTAYTRSESDVYGTKNAAGTNPRYTDKVRSAAADWSFYPIGTVFRVKDMQQLFVIDDYDLTLIGTSTIGMYQPSLDMMKSWGCRNIEISIVQWGSFERSAEILKDRTKFPHCRQMLSNIIRLRPDLNRR
jgi:TPR repeat protein/3D (Asp-Asp-Asp) domain-containing protein